MNTSTLLIIFIGGAVVVFGGFFGVIILLQSFLNKNQPKTTPPAKETSEPETDDCAPAERAYHAVFSLRNIYFLIAIGAICLVFILVFMNQLSAEPTFRFNSAGEPSSSTTSARIIIFSLLAQALFIAVGWFIGTGTRNFINRLGMPQTSGLPAQKLISVTANMVALPQLVAAFITIDIFTYDLYQLHLMPIWIFAIITMLLGGIFIFWQFYNIKRQKNQ